ncbi:MAG: hypothetical protein IPL61_33695 [Myxococcales bacterium]|nr:hypothetical protein [Myxococcales bacterium]
MSASEVLAGVRAQLAKVSLFPAAGERAPAWPTVVVVAAGLLIGLGAWLAGRGFLAIGVAPAIAGPVAILAGVLLGAAVIERGMGAAYDRWLGARWAPLAIGGSMLLRVVALWSTAPSAWWAALCLPAGLGRLAAVGLQRLGDVAPAPRGRSFVIGRVAAIELVVATALVAMVAVAAAGGMGLALLGIAAVVAVVLGLALDMGEGELSADSLAVAAAAIELVAAVGLAALDPAARSPFVG